MTSDMADIFSSFQDYLNKEQKLREVSDFNSSLSAYAGMC